MFNLARRSILCAVAAATMLALSGCAAPPGAAPAPSAPPAPPVATPGGAQLGKDKPPAATALPAAGPTARATTAPTAVPSPSRAATAAPIGVTATATPTEKGPDARRILLQPSDLGQPWAPSQTAGAASSSRRAEASFDWMGAARQSPEGLSRVSAEVTIHASASAAKEALDSSTSGKQVIGAPEVGDLSRCYTEMIDDVTRAVHMEAVAVSVGMRVSVFGSPRSEVKVTMAAELMGRMISRLSPAAAIPPATPAAAGSPALSRGTVEAAQKTVGITVALPRFLPAGASREDDLCRYYVQGDRGMIQVAYRVGPRSFAVEYLKQPAAGPATPQGKSAPVGPFKATVYTVPKEPGDLFPPTNGVIWRDGDVTIRVHGDLPAEELLRTAQSIYR